MFEQILQLDDETSAKARSALIGDTLYFADIPEVSS
jgi:hypothetical protein